MAKTRILIIDSDQKFAQTVCESMLALGYDVTALPQLHDMRFLKDVNTPHLIVANGIDLLRAIRVESKVPVVVVCANCSVEDRIAGIEAGADDFLCRPIDPRELVARVQSILRRVPQPKGAEVAREWQFRGLTVQSNRRRVLLDNEAVELTTAEFDLLRMFVMNSQQPLSREQILDQLRGIEWEAVDRSIDILVSRLRDKLRDDPRKPRFIRTIRSVGYQFIGEPIGPAAETSQQLVQAQNQTAM